MLETTVVGSFPQPDWLLDREKLRAQAPPRVRARELWRVDDRYLAEAQDDATVLAILDMERAGIDVVSDGEIRRESYSNHLATALDGIDLDNPGVVPGRGGGTTIVPRVVGPIRRRTPLLRRDAELLRQTANHRVKMTVPGPFTMAQQAKNDFYPDDRSMALDMAAVINAEVRDLEAAGVDVIQIDEPWLQSRVEAARSYAIEVIDRALDGVRCQTALHTCFGYAYIASNKPPGYAFLAELNECAVQQISIEAAQPGLDLSVLDRLPDKTIILGVLDLADPGVEPPEVVAARIRAALPFVSPDRLVLAPDCGMKYLPREIALGKLRSMVEAARTVRTELDG
jgi:5-methyltetrahydropteroyltriglutamate--homocysteine methyltransferase